MDAQSGSIGLGHRVDQLPEGAAPAIAEVAALTRLQARDQRSIQAFGVLGQCLGEQAGSLDHPVRREGEGLVLAMAMRQPVTVLALQSVDAAVQNQLGAALLGDTQQRLQIGVTVEDAGIWRMQGGDGAQGRLAAGQLGAVQCRQFGQAARLGIGLQAFQFAEFLRRNGHQQLADTPVADLMLRAPGVQALAAFPAEFGLERAGRVVEAGMDDFGVAAGGVAADQAFALQDQDAPARLCQSGGAGQAKGAGAYDEDVVVRVVAISHGVSGAALWQVRPSR